ncbi:MAG: DUF2130 domain-containing protein [Gammaproteobacteria bacterium]
MALQSESVLGRFPGRRTRPDEERCPLCNQPLPHELSADELQARLQEKEREAATATERRLRTQFEAQETAKIEAVRQRAAVEAVEREKRIWAKAETQAEASKADIAKANAEKAKALEEKQAALEAANKLKADQEEHINQAVQKAIQEQREVLDKEKTKAVHHIQAQEFEKTQKLQKQVEALKRQLDQKTAGELGEGAEIDLYEALRESFDGDRIARIKKGLPGADILHEVKHNGQVCGSIIYDSKNHSGWRDSFVEKLKTDQLAAQADHAILATSSFPRGARQLCVRDDVIIISAARVVELVRIIREHIIQSHRLRLSTEEREQKTEALYGFINSDRCRQLMSRYETIADDLLKVDEKEMKEHRLTWERRGKLIRDAQKVHGNFRTAIDRIIED